MTHPTSARRTAPGDEAAVQLPVLPPWQALAELAILTALILGMDALLTTVDLADMQPNPFWFPVLLLSLQYGTVSGVLAAGVAIVATMLSGIPEQGVGENHFAYFVRVWAQPILWIAAAVFFGQFRMRQIGYKQELLRQVKELTGERSALADYATNLRTRCDSLERELVARPAAEGLVLLDAIAGAQRGDSRETAFVRLLDSALPQCSASLYAVGADGLHRVAAHGWPADAPWKAKIAPAEPLYLDVVEGRLTLSVLQPGDEARLAGEGLAATPVIAHDGSRTLGVLKIERAPGSLVDAALPARLQVLAAALAPMIEGRAAASPFQLLAATVPLAAAGPLDRPRAAGRPRAQVRWLPAGRGRSKLPDAGTTADGKKTVG